MRGNRPGFGDDVLSSEDRRAAAVNRRAARVAAESVRHLRGVAEHDIYVGDLHSELVRGDLGHRRLLTLAVAMEAHGEPHLSIGLYPHLGGVVPGGNHHSLALPLRFSVGRLLDVEGDPDAAVDAVLGQLGVLAS